VIVRFKRVPDVEQLLVESRVELFERLEMLVLFVAGVGIERIRGAGAGDDVFALGVDQPFAVEFIFAGGGVAGEGHAGGGGFTHVAEHHALDVDGGAPFVRNPFDAAVGDRFLSVPALEHGVDAALKLLHRVVGEVGAEGFADLLFERLAEHFEVGDGEVGVVGVALLLLEFLEHFVELAADRLAFGGLDPLGLLHHHVGVHHDQPAIGVVDEAFVAGLGDQAGDGRRGEAHIEHGFHHARHRAAGAGAAGDEERVDRVAEFHAHHFFDLAQRGLDLGVHALGQLASHLEIIDAAFGGDGESGGHRQSERSHFREVGAFAAQKILHRTGAFGITAAEGVHILLFRHTFFLPVFAFPCFPHYAAQ